MRITFLALFLAGLMGCEPLPTDTTPPRLMDTEVSADGQEVALTFDEALTSANTGIDDQPPEPTPIEGSQVKVPVPKGLKPGSGHVWSAEVGDPARNTTSVAGKFHAANPDPASLRLNEVRVAGSGSHTDLVELRVEASGSLAGWTVEVWAGPDTRWRTVLPDVEVGVGELIVIRYKPPQEATDSAPGAREFWQAEAKGLPGTKGLVLLRQRPDGPGTDGLLYAKKPGEAGPIAEAAGWTGEELDPSGCTATRTWCRTDETEATWMVVANGAATPGAPNKLTPWAGPPSSPGETPKTKGRSSGPGAIRRRERPWSPWSRSTQEEEEGSREPKVAPTGSRNEKHRRFPASQIPRRRVHPPAGPIPRYPRNLRGALRPPEAPDGEAGPVARTTRPRPTGPAGTGPAGSLRREEAMLSV